ncbi:hypothetical protein ACEYYB_01410 [Paracoccus sp. p4-l81]|uniref:hypothetical protein n=1 Tax=unclassified Paracoccus (in: a-proteobacteria) TaxID=2688777 RepID=UPI0035B8E64A
MDMRWLLRMAQWARNPPSARMVALVFAVIAIGLALVGLEKAGLWPDWAVMQGAPRGSLARP